MDLISTYVQQYGCIGIFLIVFLEYANLPLPSEIVLPMVGFFVANGHIGFIQALIISVIAGVTGCMLNYLLGKYLGYPFVRKLVKGNDKLSKSLDESLVWINRYGNLSVMMSRVIPLIRTFISIPAGIVKLPIVQFVVYSSIGICVWNSILIGLGFIFAENLDKIAIILKSYSYIMIAVIAIVVVGIMIYRKKVKTKCSTSLEEKVSR